MLGKIKNFITTQKTAFIWTALYFAALHVVMLVLFRFDMLSAAAWAKLPKVSLHGLSGLAFGVLILAALPVWLGILLYIGKNKKAPFPLPFASAKKEEKKEEAPAEAAPTPEPEIPMPANLPRELREPYRRLSRDGGAAVRSAFEMNVKPAEAAEEKPKAVSQISIPESFDDASAGPAAADSFPIPDFDAVKDEEKSAPVFREITFGSGPPAARPGAEIETAKALSALGFDTESDGDTVIAKKPGLCAAVATHSDSDFWVADDETWFATGKQKPSPVAAVLAAAARHGAQPVLYLAESNILDVDGLRSKCTASGVRVVTELGQV